MNNIYKLSSYSFHAGEKILIDANIWLYLFPAPSNPKKQVIEKYSKAFFRLMQYKAQPILDPMILSEYLNRYARIEWKAKFETKYPDFKNFRKSDSFTEIASSAMTFSKKIISYCEVPQNKIDKSDLINAVSYFYSGTIDFNDAIFVEICKKENIKLMTHDGDFISGDIEILTENLNLLNSKNIYKSSNPQ